MALKYHSIDMFFAPTPTASSQPSSPTSAPPDGDGFTTEELNTVLHPSINNSWKPECHYEDKDIGSLDAGPLCVCVQGRIANFFDQPSTVKKPKAAKGCVKMIVKDDTGAFTVGSPTLDA
jgi:hypothetical protein